MAILILADEAGRARRFRLAAASLLPEARVEVWASAKQMVRELDKHLADARLLSLDHDLYVRAGEPDPGDGWELAQHLGTLLPVCPVIVHTSNSERGRWMVGELELANWIVKRVLPIGDDWIERDWTATARCLLGGE